MFSAALLLLASTFPALQGQPVIDAANIIDDKQEAELNTKLTQFWKENDRQLVVATVTTLDDRDIETFAVDYFRHLGVGSKEMNDGVLLLVAPNQRKVRIEVGYGLEETLTDYKSADIIQNTILPRFKIDEYSIGIVEGSDRILQNITPEAIQLAADNARKEKERQAAFNAGLEKFFSWLAIILASIGSVFGIYWLATIPKRRRKKEAEEAERKERALRMAAAQERERLRQIELNKARRAAEAKRKAEWEEYLKNETPDQKRERLAKEAAAAAAAAVAAAEAEKRRLARRKAEESRRRSSSYSSSSSSSSYSSGGGFGGFSGGGGSSGGGGASGSW